ncbi:glomulin-like [Diachasmimorpha longicaudata]|uniref:glomulin-like n=1 Tax=Diachasmimorpha longicaudata TaxID=58733 RepID=UPI0030B902B4
MSKETTPTIPPDTPEDFIASVKHLLTTYEPQNLSEYFSIYQTNDILNQTSWSLVPVICAYLTEENLRTRKDFFRTCQRLLLIFADKCNPAETVLIFLEQVENLSDDVRFVSLLKPIELSLRKGDLSKSIDWVVSTIRAYAEDLPQVENINPEMISPDAPEDPIIERLTTIHREILNFLSSVVDISLNKKQSKRENVKIIMNLLNIHLNLFSKPFCHLNVKAEDTSSVFYLMISQMLILEKNPLKFLKIIEDRSHKRVKNFTSEAKKNDLYNLELQLFDLEVSDLTYANFFLTLISSESLFRQLPQVYHPHYIMHCCFYLATCLLKQPEYILISKGLRLVESALMRVAEESIQPDGLQLTRYNDLFTSISQVMIYCDSSVERQFALHVFQECIKRFSIRARYMVIRQLYETTKHSGLLALIINILKSSIIISLDREDVNFIEKMEWIFERIFSLPHGCVSDFVELSEEIIAALNLLRFLVIRDKSNITGIWKFMRDIQNGYLKEVRDGVELAKAHWKMKVKDLEVLVKRKGLEYERTVVKVSIIVGGQELPDMPLRQKMEFCYQAINALDVIESIVIRVNECVRSLWTSRITLAEQKDKNVSTETRKTEEPKQESEEEYEGKIKKQILTAAMSFVKGHGWSQDAISAGAESIGYPGVIHGLFPSGGAELVLHFYANCNAELNEIMKSGTLVTGEEPSQLTQISEKFVKKAVERRLRMLIPYKSTWPQAMGLLALPPNVPPALANLLTLVDDICYYAGDRSVDFHWYTRRIAVAGIYKTSELYMLQDESEDHKQTWEFLGRRIEDAVQLNRALCVDLPPPDQALNKATEAATAVFTTARNILGMNWNR